ncbi:LOW QUALITY PROTEIN: PHD finger protein 7-like [Gavia stellata]|uniref:LOW QUALITY PROTEIN: PHD finger protein 7-like n=1 Tax=Gavia stellata TaxID=37040 RepID=UPI00289BE10E|nr:LOW QUALITY PROTEIN: PHD finger protein 7-like [Gavia stellata]
MERAPASTEQACMLCRRAEADPDICGRKLEKEGLCAHVFCLFFANELYQQRLKELGLMGFLPEDIRRTIQRAARKDCFVCGENGAAITCHETDCDRSFHLPCAVEGGCVTQFLPQYRSFCWEHRPEQAVEAAPDENTTCLICLDPVGDRKSYGTMVCPACKHAWFHRGCIQVGALPLAPGHGSVAPGPRAKRLLMFLLQGQAARAGISCFQCPLCRDKEEFVLEMLTMGIRIPFRLPSWENSHGYAALYERHGRCDASECLCPGGREQAEEEGPWQLLLCCSCAAEGTHRRCAYSGNSTASWECNSCAGLGTDSSAALELAGPSTASQSGSGLSHGSPAPKTSSPSTSSQAALVQSLGSPAPETSSPSSASQAPSGSLPLQDSLRSSPPGPERVRERSRLQRRAQTPYSRPSRHGGRSRAPAPSAESSTPSQAVLGLSHSSLVPETSSPSTGSHEASGSSCGSPAPEASSPSTGSHAASGPSHGSPVLEGSSRSSPPGPKRVRDRSRLRHLDSPMLDFAFLFSYSSGT